MSVTPSRLAVSEPTPSNTMNGSPLAFRRTSTLSHSRCAPMPVPRAVERHAERLRQGFFGRKTGRVGHRRHMLLVAVFLLGRKETPVQQTLPLPLDRRIQSGDLDDIDADS